ncbi:MAG: hypothetical protein CBC84_003245 [Pelagibacteraceae bacterium TMED124]|nr:hypothetical protein [Rickettsiales bacterium]RPG16528.1 MAG: hypothetical protein CBC84_003245 [Pelagibacteraceae bacterium TMED124]|tara:strand:- start:557 stop:850 length:294 start_codon:yes stop_codon:yes gene_type:complete
MEDFEKGAKRKCTQCSTLFFDFGKFPIVCPNCGYELTSLLTNVSKRGRPPKNVKSEEVKEEKEIKIDEIEDEEEIAPSVSDEDDSVEDIIEIEREGE